MLKVEDVVENLTGYIESRIEVIKLDLKNEITHAGVNAGVGIIVGIFGLLTLFCLTVALGFWLGDVVDSRALGFVLAGAFFLLLSALLLASKAALQRLVARRVFSKYSQNKPQA